MNNMKTLILLGALTGILLWAGNLAGGRGGMLVALVFAGIMNISAYWFSDKIVLRSYNAQPLLENTYPRIYSMVRELAAGASMPVPGLYRIAQKAPNAFATGRNPQNGAVVLSDGIIGLLSEEELKGVIAHEMSHIRHRDTLIQSVAATIGGAIMFLAYQARWFAFLGGGSNDDDDGGIAGLLAMAILAPLAASLIQMAISRSREYKADAGAAELTHYPEGLASALEKLGYYSKKIPMKARGQSAHIFTVSPISGRSLMNLFSTHPPLEQRISRLRSPGGNRGSSR